MYMKYVVYLYYQRLLDWSNFGCAFAKTFNDYFHFINCRSFKDFRRRSVEAVLVTVGASERTVDDDFISIHNKFDHLCSTMTNCKHHCGTF